MSLNHENLNKKRSEDFRKPSEEEAFLEQFNNTLHAFEHEHYADIEPEHPFLFIIGLPRSGTTLLSQLVAHCLDVGYINNLAARFWKAPVTGIKLSNNVLSSKNHSGFESHYGATEKLTDIHEFGYFWREWLKKDSFENIKNARDIEDRIEWNGLRRVLANIQVQFNRPMVFKNIFGSYHIPKLNEILDKTLWIYIERDPLDTAVSILKARKKYYDDPKNWWSYVPPEYEKIIDKDYWHQIAGQIHYLKEFYHKELDKLKESRRGLKVTYEELSKDPASILVTIQQRISSLYNLTIPIKQEPPDHFEMSTYNDHPEEKKRFQELLQEYQAK